MIQQQSPISGGGLKSGLIPKLNLLFDSSFSLIMAFSVSQCDYTTNVLSTKFSLQYSVFCIRIMGTDACAPISNVSEQKIQDWLFRYFSDKDLPRTYRKALFAHNSMITLHSHMYSIV